MKELAIILRALQLTAHSAHNLAQGPLFMQNHDFFGGLYPMYETAYDSVIERILGTSTLSIKELSEIQVQAANLSAKTLNSSEFSAVVNILLNGEAELQSRCEKAKGSAGTLNLVAQLADDSEVRSYKMKQMLK